MADPRNFLLNTDYPVDKVVYINQGSVSMAGGVDRDIAHGLPFIPLVSFVWSFTPDFSVTYQYNMGPFPSGNPGYFFSLQVSISANATNIRLSGNGVLGATTIYYRIFAFVPDDFVGDIPSTTTLADNFVLLTDLNYTKLLTSSSVVLAPGQVFPIGHGLGYFPQVLAWVRPNNGPTIYPLEAQSPYNVNSEITTSSLILNNQDFQPQTVYYRIYTDE